MPIFLPLKLIKHNLRYELKDNGGTTIFSVTMRPGDERTAWIAHMLTEKEAEEVATLLAKTVKDWMVDRKLSSPYAPPANAIKQGR